jgi:hypothetical protein
MAVFQARGVPFSITHSLFPMFTGANASGMAAGQLSGDTGGFGNSIYAGFQVPGAGESLTPFLAAIRCWAISMSTSLATT